MVFLNASGRGGMGFAFLLSYDFSRMGARSVLQYSQFPSLQPRSSMSCWASNTHLPQACAFYSPVAQRSMRCTSSLLFASPPWPETTAGQVAPVSLWASSVSQAQACCRNHTQGEWCLQQPQLAAGQWRQSASR